MMWPLQNFAATNLTTLIFHQFSQFTSAQYLFVTFQTIPHGNNSKLNSGINHPAGLSLSTSHPLLHHAGLNGLLDHFCCHFHIIYEVLYLFPHILCSQIKKKPNFRICLVSLFKPKCCFGNRKSLVGFFFHLFVFIVTQNMLCCDKRSLSQQELSRIYFCNQL